MGWDRGGTAKLLGKEKRTANGTVRATMSVLQKERKKKTHANATSVIACSTRSSPLRVIGDYDILQFWQGRISPVVHFLSESLYGGYSYLPEQQSLKRARENPENHLSKVSRFLYSNQKRSSTGSKIKAMRVKRRKNAFFYVTRPPIPHIFQTYIVLADPPGLLTYS